MSKITQALEKAARERAQRKQEHATVAATSPMVVPLAAPRGVGAITAAGQVTIDPHIVCATDPKSPIAEQYRILRTNLQSLRMRPGSSRVILLTSSVHEEGKTVTAINLALSLARQENLKVVLVDADLRKGSVQKWLQLPQTGEGLSTALGRGGELNGALVRLEDPPLAILPSGVVAEHPAELLESSHMRRLLASLKAQFDIILIDAPPVLPVADPSILAAQADGVLFVVRAGKTQRKTVAQAQALLAQTKANVLGCILTHVEHYLPGYYRYYHSYRYGTKDGNGKSPDTLQVAGGVPASVQALGGDTGAVA